jgi:Tfp pilus assembly protein PilX
MRRGRSLLPPKPTITSISRDERGAMIVIALMILTVLATLGITAMNSTTMETHISGYQRASVRAFYAAETGVQVGISQVSANLTNSIQAIPVTNHGSSATYQYRSGGRNDTAPQPLQFLGTSTKAGYSIGSGTWYNPAGYIFYTYQINATGMGPQHARREIEMRAAYGPVAQ